MRSTSFLILSACMVQACVSGCRSPTPTESGNEGSRIRVTDLLQRSDEGQEQVTGLPGYEVDLEPSFLIPQSGELTVSHIPSVVFTRDGERMVTATSEGEIIVFDRSTQQLLNRVSLSDETSNAVSIDKEGRTAVWAPDKGGVVVQDIVSGNVIARDEELTAECLAISPDGKRVALSHGDSLEIRELTHLGLVDRVSGQEGDITNLAWSWNGDLLGSTSRCGRLLVYDTAGKTVIYQVDKGEPLHAMAFHPRGDHVAYGGEGKNVHRYSFSSAGEEIISADGQPYWITCLGYSPDGELIAVGDESCDIWLYDVAGKKQIFHGKHHTECWLNSVAWAQDAEALVFGCRPNAHAGKPAVHRTLARAEAARSPEVQESRQELLRAIEDELEKVEDEEQRELLVAYRHRLGSEVQIDGIEPQFEDLKVVRDFAAPEIALDELAVADTDLTSTAYFLSEPDLGLDELAGAENTPDIAAADFALEDSEEDASLPAEKLSPRLQELLRKHEERLRKEIARLNANFVCNLWSVERE